jgi:hypothetical protein
MNFDLEQTAKLENGNSFIGQTPYLILLERKILLARALVRNEAFPMVLFYLFFRR